MTASSSRRWPRIVAESLTGVAEPVTTLTARPVSATVSEVIATTAAAIAPGRSCAVPPPFLQPQQVDSWRRALHALEQWGGALLAEPTGSGKSWIALGVAALESRRPLVVAPAILLPQWHEVAERAGVPVHLWSHERVSRGILPPRCPTLVIVDEAHRLRNPAIRRVHTLAPWLLGRRVLLLTATPIVNQLQDLLTLLRLVVSEDALALDGIGRLGDIERGNSPPLALRRLVIRTAGRLHQYGRTQATLIASGGDSERAAAAVATIDALALSRDAGVRRLLRTVVLDAAASSDAALHRTLARYRSLLLHARDAGGISRATIRRFAGEALEQCVLWDLVDTGRSSELVVDDLPCIDTALAQPMRDNGWIAELFAQLDTTRPAVCFTRHRATAQALRQYLGEGTAWISGSDAGIGQHRLPRATILAAFGPHREEWTTRRVAPRILITTDVAAEGLDLQAAGCIAHVDLPWTAMRLAQREGRLLRIGQLHDDVRIIVRHPAPELETRLAPQARIRRKGTLSDRWLSAMTSDDPHQRIAAIGPHVATIDDGGPDAALVVIALTRGDREGVTIVAQDGEATWSGNEATLARLWARAGSAAVRKCDHQPLDVRETLTGALRYALSNTGYGAAVTPGLIARIQRLARAAAVRRDAVALSALDRLLRFAAMPITLGGRILLDQLHDAPDRTLLGTVVTDRPRPLPVAARVVAAVLFRSSTSQLR